MAGSTFPTAQAPLFQRASAITHVPVNVLEGIASVESDFGRNKSTSSAGAQGEMQFMPGTARQFGLNPYDTANAIIDAGKLLNEYGYQSNPTRAIAAYNAGPGNVGAGAGYAKLVMSEAQRLASQMGVPSPGTRDSGSPTNFTDTTSFGGGQTDQKAALLAALMKPTISLSGKISSGTDLLSNAISNIESGKFTTPVSVKTVESASGGSLGVGAARAVGGLLNGADVNPIHGFTIGRTDMGVDANARPGDPIVAPNNGKVVGYMPNWYKGQPYVAIQLTDGPNKGRVMYVAEQISPNIKVGDTVRRGQTIARYAGQGTGIEIGWANPSNPLQTEAQATTGYSEGEQTKAGMSFKQWLDSLKS